jgi:hypothetical protein
MKLSKSLAVKAGAVFATAAIALTGATAAADATIVTSAVPAAPAHLHHFATKLSITNSKPVAHAHQTTSVVDGRLTHNGYGLRDLRVKLERLGLKGHWNVVQVKLTRAHGHVYFKVHVYKKAATFRLVFGGTANWARSTSNIDTISPATGS